VRFSSATITDEDVFRLDLPQRILSIRVGRSPRSLAWYFLHDRDEVDQRLSHLAPLP
jgi:hypothetical protein